MAKKNTSEKLEFFTATGPEWACCYAVYGEPGALTPEDCERFDKALESFEERTNSSFVTIGDYEGDDWGFDDVLDEYGVRVPYIFQRRKANAG